VRTVVTHERRWRRLSTSAVQQVLSARYDVQRCNSIDNVESQAATNSVDRDANKSTYQMALFYGRPYAPYRLSWNQFIR